MDDRDGLYSELHLPLPLVETIEWFRENFTFDNNMHRRMETDWILQHPADMLMEKKGVCHDLVAFQTGYLRGMGYEADHLMFVVYKPEEVIRFHHSLICLLCNRKYFLLEPCANYADNDCYGPYDSLDEYEALLMWRYEKAYSTPEYEWFRLFYHHNYQYGMNLQEFFDSWS